jgi:hypothetical protein
MNKLVNIVTNPPKLGMVTSVCEFLLFKRTSGFCSGLIYLFIDNTVA